MQSTSVPPSVRQQFAALGSPEPMRRGSLSERYMKCSKPGCACLEDPEARHGPYYSWTRGIGGQTQSRLVSPEQASEIRKQIDRGQQFREQIEIYWRTCEQWADEELGISTAASRGAAEKKGSKPRSRPRSARKSKGS